MLRQPSKTIRIAMWSGPRNISTAMMRSWGNRDDTVVIDEPFYAAYLNATGIVHPMQQEVLASQSKKFSQVIKTELENRLPQDKFIHYQKHMTQHMVTDIDEAWFSSLRHAFLIRNPEEVVASYGVKRESICQDDLGFAKQKELYDKVVSIQGRKPPVVDARDVSNDPEGVLHKLCECLGVPFAQSMLNWSAGPRDSDGVWARHWYQNVEKSTGFLPFKNKQTKLTKEQKLMADRCQPYYQEMYKDRI